MTLCHIPRVCTSPRVIGPLKRSPALWLLTSLRHTSQGATHGSSERQRRRPAGSCGRLGEAVLASGGIGVWEAKVLSLPSAMLHENPLLLSARHCDPGPRARGPRPGRTRWLNRGHGPTARGCPGGVRSGARARRARGHHVGRESRYSWQVTGPVTGAGPAHSPRRSAHTLVPRSGPELVTDRTWRAW